MIWISCFVAAFILVYLLMPIFIRLMEKYKILDSSGGRKIHKGYTAHLGGVVIFFAFAIAMFSSVLQMVDKVNMLQLLAFITLLSIVVVLGIRDDMNSLSPKIKLFCEILVGFLFCYLDIRLYSFYGLFGVGELPVWLSYILTIALIIIVCNAYNLIDGIDGQAGMQALSVFIFLAGFLMHLIYTTNVLNLDSFFANANFWMIAFVAIIGSIVGFLVFNWQPAKIFMGDTGSLFIGTLIALSIIMSMNYSGADPILIGEYEIKAKILVFPMFFFLPLADTLRVFISRIKRGKSPFSADKTHIHHFLLRTGYSHQRTTITTFVIQAIVSIISIIVAFLISDLFYIIYIVAIWVIYVVVLRFTIQKKIANLKHN
ncbi:MAG: MraY family glycosyltransferase [Bacteroidales bacterium]|nr:MraY family glycosyltransferase [Bacteroidales bacterium]